MVYTILNKKNNKLLRKKDNSILVFEYPQQASKFIERILKDSVIFEIIVM